MVSLLIVYVIHIYVNLYCVHTYIIKTCSFYIITHKFTFIKHVKLCCSTGATTCHQTRYIKVPGASSYYHIKLF